jgi:DNA-binding response OmpR family regulator
LRASIDWQINGRRAVSPDEHVERLLLVDDNPTNLQVLFEALQAEGYELLVAQSGDEAITTAQRARPDLILLDINMPGIDGYETCRRLKADEATRDTVIIFLSARGDVDDKVRGLELGAVDYIAKPFQFEEVVARVRKHLAIHQEQRALQVSNQALRQQLAGGFAELSAADLKRLVADGESDSVEFKSTLRWNLHTNKPDKRMENACLKTAAAYLNSSGGALFVGVDDEGRALGMSQDQFANEDKLLLHWNGLLKTHLGMQAIPFIRSAMRDLDDQRVLLVQCLPSREPVFFRRDNDETFFIRTGNGTHALKPSEVLAYVAQRSEN